MKFHLAASRGKHIKFFQDFNNLKDLLIKAMILEEQGFIVSYTRLQFPNQQTTH